MMRRPTAVLFSISLLLSACRSEPAQAPPAPAAEPDAAPAAQPAEPIERMPVYDTKGALRPSDKFVVGIQLPLGLEPFHEDNLMHVYRIRAPIRKVLAYFGPMLITGRVERQGQGAVYRKASVRGAEMSPTKVDVSILDIGNGLTRVAITELPPPPAYPPAEAEVRQQAVRDFRLLD